MRGSRRWVFHKKPRCSSGVEKSPASQLHVIVILSRVPVILGQHLEPGRGEAGDQGPAQQA